MILQDESFEDMKEKAIKYADYTQGSISQIAWKDPESPEQVEMIKRRMKKSTDESVFRLTGVCIIFIFILSLILFFGEMEFSEKIPVLVMFIFFLVLPIVFLCLAKKIRSKDIKVATGTCIYRSLRRNGSSNTPHFYITFLPDDGSKVFYKNIPIDRTSYNLLSDDTPVVLFKCGSKIGACVIN